MTAVKIGQTWRDKDKRRNTEIIIEDVFTSDEKGLMALANVLGTADEREYSVDRLVKRWELVKEAEPQALHLSDAVEAVRDRGAVLKVIANNKEQVVEVPQRIRPKQPVYQLKIVCSEGSEYKVRTTQKMLDDYGFPFCACHKKQMELADA